MLGHCFGFCCAIWTHFSMDLFHIYRQVLFLRLDTFRTHSIRRKVVIRAFKRSNSNSTHQYRLYACCLSALLSSLWLNMSVIQYSGAANNGRHFQSNLSWFFRLLLNCCQSGHDVSCNLQRRRKAAVFSLKICSLFSWITLFHS